MGRAVRRARAKLAYMHFAASSSLCTTMTFAPSDFSQDYLLECMPAYESMLVHAESIAA